MSESFRILGGDFGRIIVYRLDQSITTHVHRMCHFAFKIGGPDVNYGVKGKEVPLGAKDLVLINAWEPHFYNHHNGDEPITLLEISLERQWLASISNRFSLCTHPRFFSVPCLSISDQIKGHLDELTYLMTYCPAPDIKDVTAQIHGLVLTISNNFAASETLSNHDLIGGLRCDPRIRRVLSLTDQENTPCLTVDQMVKTAGVSRPRFFQLFKQETQLTPHIFANMHRMENAIRLVSKAKPSVTDIAFQLGFESPGNFTRFFRSHQGITPIQYRRSAC